jgi:hypothetical protein
MHVPRLDVAMEHTLTVRVADRVGEAAADEADGVDMIESGELLPVGELRRIELGRHGVRPVDRGQQLGAGP